EDPLGIRVGKESVAFTMRTPGDDTDLTAGFVLSEGIVRRRADVQEISHCTLPASLGNVVNVTLSPGVEWSAASTHRLGTISTSCGLCGKTSIDFIRQQFPPLDKTASVRLAVARLLQMPD